MRLTASKSALVFHCGYSFRDDAPQDPYRPSQAAERGVRIHKALEEYVRDGVIPSEGEDAAIVKNVAEWLKHHDGSGKIVEVAFGYDVASDTATALEVTGRDYPKDLLCGRADLVLVEARTIVDWKSGDGGNASAQLRTLGLMAARAYGWDTVTVLALEVRQSGVQERCRQTFDAFDLDVIAGELAEQIASIPTAEPVPGSHCAENYCAARISCPIGKTATAELVDVIPADALVRAKPYRLTDPITTASHAAWALDVVRLVGARIDALKDEIRSKIPDGGWILDDGRVLREGHTTAHSFSKDKAIALLKELGARDEDIERCQVEYQRSTGLRVSGGTTRRKWKAA